MRRTFATCKRWHRQLSGQRFFVIWGFILCIVGIRTGQRHHGIKSFQRLSVVAFGMHCTHQFRVVEVNYECIT